MVHQVVRNEAAHALSCILQMIISDLATVEEIHASLGLANHSVLKAKVNDAVFVANNTIASLRPLDANPSNPEPMVSHF